MAKEMLVTEGLNELKTLDARIERAIGDAKFIVDAKDSDEKISRRRHRAPTIPSLT